MNSRATIAATCLAALTLAACGGDDPDTAAVGGDGAEAAAFTPEGDVTMVIPFSPGGGSDRAGRAVAAALEEAAPDLNINAVNREGGSGAVGYSYFLGQEGDPQTLLATETSLLTLPINQNVEFTYEDFTPIIKIADDYTLMVAPADSPFETCPDVFDAAGQGRVLAGISGRGGLDDIVFSLSEDETGVELDRVTFESGGELIAALLGGTIQVASLNPGEVLGQLESGDLKALCAYSEERYDYEALADVPTATEQGIPVAFAQFRGVLAPGGISEEARQYWIDTLTDATETEAYAEYIESSLLQPNVAAGDDFVAYLEENNAELQQALGE